MFYGHCLKIGGQTVIFYSEYLGSDNKWHKGVYDVDFDGKNTIQNPAVIPYDTIMGLSVNVLNHVIIA